MNPGSVIARIWGLKYFIILSAGICAVAASLVVSYLPNRYLASATIQLDTRFETQADVYAVQSKRIDPFVKTQAATIKDIRVTGRVVDQLGWEQSYAMAQEYNRVGSATGEDFRTWLGNRVADRILLNFEEGSPSFTMSYVGLSPEEAMTMATVIRDAFINYSATGSRSQAEENVEWIDTRLAALRSEMQKIEKRNSDFGLENDIILDGNGISQFEARLAQTSSAPILPIDQKVATVSTTNSPTNRQLAEIDAEISRLSATLGPNHPRLQNLRATRDELAKTVAQASSAAAAPAPQPEVSREARLSRLEQEYFQKAEAIQTAKRYAADLAALEQQFAELSQRKQAFALDSTTLRPTASSGGPVVPLGEVYYPRRTFAIAGAAGFGALLAIFLGLFFSLLKFRVRSNDELRELGMPVLGTPKQRTGLQIPKPRLSLGS